MNGTETTFEVNGVRLHATETGPPDGPLVMLLHGFPEFSWGWRKQLEALAGAGYRVLAPDQRGYHRSHKPRGLSAYHLDVLAADVLALADARGAATFRLVGHDWGGIVAWWVATRHPERVAQLAVLNAPHPDAWRHLARRRLRQALKSYYVALFQLPFLPEWLLRAGGFRLLRRAMTGTARRGTFSREDLDRYAEAWAQPGALTAMLNYYRALRLRRPAASARVRPETLVLWGVRDAFLERATAEASLRMCDRGTGIFRENATHWLHLEEADFVNDALLRFFGKKSPPTP